MKNLPYFRWYPADAETDAAYSAMTWAERGFYHWCLNYAWINDGLPADLNELARVAKMPRREMDKLWPRVGSRFAEDSGVLRNPRQEEERKHAVAKSRQSSKAVEAREAKRKVRSSDDTSDDHPRAYDSDSVSDSSSGKGGLGGKPQRWESDEQYAPFVADYRGTGAAVMDEDFEEAYEFCWRALDFEQKLERVAGLNRHAEEYHADPRFVPRPRKFLESEWKRPLKPRPKARDSGYKPAAPIPIPIPDKAEVRRALESIARDDPDPEARKYAEEKLKCS